MASPGAITPQPGAGKGGSGTIVVRGTPTTYLIVNGQLVTPAEYARLYPNPFYLFRPRPTGTVTETTLATAPVGIAKPPADLVPPPTPSSFPKAAAVPQPPRAEGKPSGAIYVPPAVPRPRAAPGVISRGRRLGGPTQAEIRRAFGARAGTALTFAQVVAALELAEANLQTAGARMAAIEAQQLAQGFGSVSIGRINSAAAALSQAYLQVAQAQSRAEAAARSLQSLTATQPPSEELKKLRAQAAAAKRREIEAAYRKATEGIRRIRERIAFSLGPVSATGANNPLFLAELSEKTARHFLNKLAQNQPVAQGTIIGPLAVAGLAAAVRALIGLGSHEAGIKPVPRLVGKPGVQTPQLPAVVAPPLEELAPPPPQVLPEPAPGTPGLVQRPDFRRPPGQRPSDP